MLTARLAALLSLASCSSDFALSARDAVLVQLTGFLTTLAMNYVYKGAFIAK